jgi:hypothetical protein
MEASLAQLAAVGGSQGASQLMGANVNAKLFRQPALSALCPGWTGRQPIGAEQM